VDGVSLILLGAEITYADIEYLVEAQLTLCNPTNDYHVRVSSIRIVGVAIKLSVLSFQFMWEMVDLPVHYENITKITGKIFRIPPNALNGGKDYDILVKLVKTSDSFMITQVKIPVYPLAFFDFLFFRHASNSKSCSGVLTLLSCHIKLLLEWIEKLN
jgi:hypothetical protein